MSWQSLNQPRALGNKKSVLLLLIGLVLGFLIASMFSASDASNLIISNGQILPYYGHEVGDVNDDHHGHMVSESSGPEQDIGHHNHMNEIRTVADRMYKDVKVLCWIMTNPKNHKKKARHVQRTWGKRCNKLIFMSSEADKELGSVALPVKEGRQNLWGKTKEAFKYVYSNHIDEYDWFLKADDDTYVVVENLRYMLYPHSPDSPIYFGCKFKPFVKQGYMSGGAGYVLSREAVKRFVENGVKNKTMCRDDAGGAEDVEMGKCLEKVKVVAGDSRDTNKRGRFFPFVPEHHLIPGHANKDFWYWNYIYYKTDEGLDCCSDHAVSFHYISPNQMYVLDYLIYHLRPYGIIYKDDVIPEKLPPPPAEDHTIPTI